MTEEPTLFCARRSYGMRSSTSSMPGFLNAMTGSELPGSRALLACSSRPPCGLAAPTNRALRVGGLIAVEAVEAPKRRKECRPMTDGTRYLRGYDNESEILVHEVRLPEGLSVSFLRGVLDPDAGDEAFCYSYGLNSEQALLIADEAQVSVKCDGVDYFLECDAAL